MLAPNFFCSNIRLCKVEFDKSTLNIRLCKAEFDKSTLNIRLCKAKFDKSTLNIHVCKAEFDKSTLNIHVCKAEFDKSMPNIRLCKGSFGKNGQNIHPCRRLKTVQNSIALHIPPITFQSIITDFLKYAVRLIFISEKHSSLFQQSNLVWYRIRWFIH